MPCDFAARSSDQQADSTSTQTISSNNSSTGSYLLESQLTSSELTELELLHNYSTSTCFSLAEYQEVQHIWETQVPQIGFDHFFVLEMVPTPAFSFSLSPVFSLSVRWRLFLSLSLSYAYISCKVRRLPTNNNPPGCGSQIMPPRTPFPPWKLVALSR